MGREVRKVPADWVHPTDEDDQHIPLLDGNFKEEYATSLEERRQWEAGMKWCYATKTWIPKNPEWTDSADEWFGPPPMSEEYMPSWGDEERTHLMMYETVSEGTPLSPAFATPDELARWLVDNKASAFGYDTATYEQWLSLCREGGSVPTMIMTSDGTVEGTSMVSGVAAFAERKTDV